MQVLVRNKTICIETFLEQNYKQTRDRQRVRRDA